MPWLLRIHPGHDAGQISGQTLGQTAASAGRRDRNIVRGEVAARFEFIDDAAARSCDPRLLFEKNVFPPFVNCEVDPTDPDVLRASVNGWLKAGRERIVVEDVLVLDGDLDEATGFFSFVGDLVVRGDVLRLAQIQARSVRVEGKVDGGYVRTAGDAVVEGGVNGLLGENAQRGMIKAGGDVRAAFCENARIHAGGSVLVDGDAMNSEIRAGDRIAVAGGLRGGRICCRRSVRVGGAVGARFGQETIFLLGYDPELLRRAEAIEKARRGVLAKLDDARRQELRGGVAAHFGRKLEEELLARLEAFDRRKREVWRLVGSQGFDREACLVALGEVRVGVEIAIGPAYLRVEEPLRDVVFAYGGKDIVVSPGAEREASLSA